MAVIVAIGVIGALVGRWPDQKKPTVQADSSADKTTKGQPQPAPPSKAETTPTKVPEEKNPFLAPPPHPVPLNRPPEGFTSAWVRCGGVQTRITGACIVFPTLIDNAKREFPSRTAALLVWVETQNLTSTTGVSLRRWQNPLNEFATLTGADGVRIKPAKFPAESRVGGQLEGGRSLVPGGPGIVDILAFEVPNSAANKLQLRLTGSHVAEDKDFFHTIPYEIWSKK